MHIHEIYYERLSHEIIKAENSQGLQSGIVSASQANSQRMSISSPSFVLFRLQTDWMRSAHIREGSLLSSGLSVQMLITSRNLHTGILK